MVGDDVLRFLKPPPASQVENLAFERNCRQDSIKRAESICAYEENGILFRIYVSHFALNLFSGKMCFGDTVFNLRSNNFSAVHESGSVVDGVLVEWIPENMGIQNRLKCFTVIRIFQLDFP